MDLKTSSTGNDKPPDNLGEIKNPSPRGHRIRTRAEDLEDLAYAMENLSTLLGHGVTLPTDLRDADGHRTGHYGRDSRDAARAMPNLALAKKLFISAQISFLNISCSDPNIAQIFLCF